MKTPNRITRLSNAALNYLKKTTGTCECEPYNHVSQCESSREIFEECATPELILLLILLILLLILPLFILLFFLLVILLILLILILLLILLLIFVLFFILVLLLVFLLILLVVFFELVLFR